MCLWFGAASELRVISCEHQTDLRPLVVSTECSKALPLLQFMRLCVGDFICGVCFKHYFHL